MKKKYFWGNLIFILIGLFCVVFWYFYSSQIINYWNLRFLASSQAKQVSITTKNCGTSVSPKLDSANSYKNDPVLSCLGASAISCENAEGYLNDSFFPTVLGIVKKNNSCSFKLSYTTGSTLHDVTGKRLAGQYLTCPLNVVKNIDNTNPSSPKLLAADKTNSSKYAGQIYLYGTIGLFLENNLDKTKIQSAGCTGDYIDTMIASSKITGNK